jgi:hypothetical protein
MRILALPLITSLHWMLGDEEQFGVEGSTRLSVDLVPLDIIRLIVSLLARISS